MIDLDEFKYNHVTYRYDAGKDIWESQELHHTWWTKVYEADITPMLNEIKALREWRSAVVVAYEDAKNRITISPRNVATIESIWIRFACAMTKIEAKLKLEGGV